MDTNVVQDRNYMLSGSATVDVSWQILTEIATNTYTYRDVFTCLGSSTKQRIDRIKSQRHHKDELYTTVPPVLAPICICASVY